MLDAITIKPKNQHKNYLVSPIVLIYIFKEDTLQDAEIMTLKPKVYSITFPDCASVGKQFYVV